MPELARFIGMVKSVGGKKNLDCQGRQLELLNASDLADGGVYRIVGTLEGSVLAVELFRKLDGFDLATYEKALGALSK